MYRENLYAAVVISVPSYKASHQPVSDPSKVIHQIELT